MFKRMHWIPLSIYVSDASNEIIRRGFLYLPLLFCSRDLSGLSINIICVLIYCMHLISIDFNHKPQFVDKIM